MPRQQGGAAQACAALGTRPTHLRCLEHVLDEVWHGGLQPVGHRQQHGHQAHAHRLAHRR